MWMQLFNVFVNHFQVNHFYCCLIHFIFLFNFIISIDSTTIPFPKLPNQFQMHVEITSQGSTFKINEYYDQDGNIGSAIMIQQGKRVQLINDYTQNLGLFIGEWLNSKNGGFYSFHKKNHFIADGSCNANKLNESDNSGFFLIHLNTIAGIQVETIGTPSEIFHFNDGYGIVSDNDKPFYNDLLEELFILRNLSDKRHWEAYQLIIFNHVKIGL